MAPLLPRPKDCRLPQGWMIAIYAIVLVWAGFEVLRALGRVDAVVFTGYVQVGEAVLQHKSPYGGGLALINTWPPFFLFVATGLALLARLSLLGTLLAWQVVGVWSIWWVLQLCARFYLDDATPSFWPRSAERLAFVSTGILVPFAMSARLFQEHAQHTQINVQVLALVLLAFHLFRRGRPALGGFSLALATSIKAVPILFLIYLLYKRAWRETIWVVAFLLFLDVVLPAAVFGPDAALSHWRQWRHVTDVQVAGVWTAHHFNQSLLAALKRLSPATGRVLFYAIAGGAALALAWAFRSHPRDLADPIIPIELAICLGAAVVVDPLAWKAHYVTLVAAYMYAWRELRAPAPRWRWVLWWGSFACLTLSASFIVGTRVSDWLETWNVILLGALLVLALALSLMPRSRPLPSRSAAPS